MKYKDHTINVECITERAEFSLTENGEIGQWLNEIDSEPEISFYSISDIDGDILEWVGTLEEAKEFIDKIALSRPNCEHKNEELLEDDTYWCSDCETHYRDKEVTS